MDKNSLTILFVFEPWTLSDFFLERLQSWIPVLQPFLSFFLSVLFSETKLNVISKYLGNTSTASIKARSSI